MKTYLLPVLVPFGEVGEFNGFSFVEVFLKIMKIFDISLNRGNSFYLTVFLLFCISTSVAGRT